jgi:hypothetical protein
MRATDTTCQAAWAGQLMVRSWLNLDLKRFRVGCLRFKRSFNQAGEDEV